MAAALLDAVGSLLDLLPIAYSVRVETAAGKRLDRTRSPHNLSAPHAPGPADDVRATALRVVERERQGPPAILPDALPHS